MDDAVLLQYIIQAQDQAKAILESQVGILDAISGALGRTAKAAEDANKPHVQLVATMHDLREALDQTIGKISDYVIESTKTAAGAEMLGTAFHVVGINAGYTSDQLDEQERKMKALGIQTQEARQIMSQMIQSQLDLSKATNLARVSQDLAVIAQMNSSVAAQTIATAIDNQNVKMLRQFGLITNQNVIYAHYAATLHKGVDELTQLEKKQAFLNEVLEFGSRAAGTYNAAMEDAGKRMLSLERYTNETAIAIGNAFLPAMSAIVDTLIDVNKALTEFATNHQMATSIIGGFIATFTILVGLLAGAAVIFNTVSAAAAGLGIALTGPVGLGIAAAVAGVSLLVAAWLGWKQTTDEVAKKQEEISAKFGENVTKLTEYRNALVELSNSSQDSTEKQKQFNEIVKKIEEQLKGPMPDNIKTIDQAIKYLNETIKTQQSLKWDQDLKAIDKQLKASGVSAKEAADKYAELEKRMLEIKKAGVDPNSGEAIAIQKQIDALKPLLEARQKVAAQESAAAEERKKTIAAQQAEQNMMDKAEKIMKDKIVSMTQLTGKQKELNELVEFEVKQGANKTLVLAALKSKYEEIAKAEVMLGGSVDKTTAAVLASIKAGEERYSNIEKNRKDAIKAAEAERDAASSIDQLSGAQIEAIRYYHEKGKTVDEIVKILQVYKKQVKDVVEGDKDAIKVHKEEASVIDGVSTSFENLGKKLEDDAKFVKDYVAAMEKVNAISGSAASQTQGILNDLFMNDFDKKREDIKTKINDLLGEINQMFEHQTDANAEAVMATWQAAYDNIMALFGAQNAVVDQAENAADAAATAASKKVHDEMSKGFTSAFVDSLSALPGLFQNAMTGGGGFGGFAKAMGSKLGSDLFGSLFGHISGTKDGVAFGGSGIAGLMEKGLGAIGIAGKALNFIPFIGPAIGAMLPMIVGAFFKPEYKKIMKDVGRDWGVNISEGLAKEIEGLEKKFHVGRQVAEILDMDKIIKEGGGLNTSNFDNYVGKLRDVFSLIKSGQMSVAQGQEVLNKNWKEFLQVGTDAYGRWDARLKEIAMLNNEIGTQSKEIQDSLKQQATAAGTAFEAVMHGYDDEIKSYDEIHSKMEDLNKQWDELNKKPGEHRAELDKITKEWQTLRDQQKAAGAAAKESLENLGIQAIAAFAAGIQSGMTFTEALKNASGGITQLQKAFEDLGIATDNAALQALFMQNTILQKNPNLLAALDGLANGFVALDNLGIMNEKTFKSMQKTGLEMYTKLQAQVAAVGGTTRDALLPMQHYLHEAQREAEALGIPLDENTQRLIDQSKELGIWKEEAKSSTQKMLDALNHIADALDRVINKILGIPDKDVDINVHTNYDTSGQPPQLPPGVPVPVPGGSDFPGPGEIPPVPGAADGVFATQPTLRVFGEGGEPELGGPVDFMTKALVGALQRVNSPQGGGTGQPIQLTVHVHADLGENSISTKLIPGINRTYANNTNGARTALQEALGI